MRLVSRLQKSRHGIYYLRIQSAGLNRRFSLRTRDPVMAAVMAHEFSAKLLSSMKINQFNCLGWVLEATDNGIKITTEDNDADRKSATEALAIVMQSRAAVVPIVPAINLTTKTLGVALVE